MKYEAYTDILERRDLGVFEFISIVKLGAIPKCISFGPTALPFVYNLAFGNIDEDGEIDDKSVSDNGDRNKILATLAKVIDQYTRKYPERLIYFRGSTKERTTTCFRRSPYTGTKSGNWKYYNKNYTISQNTKSYQCAFLSVNRYCLIIVCYNMLKSYEGNTLVTCFNLFSPAN